MNFGLPERAGELEARRERGLRQEWWFSCGEIAICGLGNTVLEVPYPFPVMEASWWGCGWTVFDISIGIMTT